MAINGLMKYRDVLVANLNVLCVRNNIAFNAKKAT